MTRTDQAPTLGADQAPTLAPERAALRAQLARKRRQRMADALAPTGAPLTGADVEAGRRAAPLVGGWDVATWDRLRRDARSVSKSDAAPPADDLVSAALLRAWENRPAALVDLTSADAARRERGHAYLRAAMRSVAGHAVRAALVPGALVDTPVTPDAETLRQRRLVDAAIGSDGPDLVNLNRDRDQARARVRQASRLVGVTDRMAETTGGAHVGARERMPFGKVNEQTVGGRAWDGKGQTRILRETSLERMLYNGARPNAHVLENGGSTTGGKTWHADQDTRRAERDAERAALADALAHLPEGDDGTLARDVYNACGKLVSMTPAGWLRRASGMQREAGRLTARAARWHGLAQTAQTGPERKNARTTGAALDRDADALRAGALVLVGAVGAADGRPLALVNLLGAACDVSREGRPSLDWSAVAAALNLPASDPVRKALRQAFRRACACPGALVPGEPLTAGGAAAGAAALAESHLLDTGAAGRWSAVRDAWCRQREAGRL